MDTLHYQTYQLHITVLLFLLNQKPEHQTKYPLNMTVLKDPQQYIVQNIRNIRWWLWLCWL